MPGMIRQIVFRVKLSSAVVTTLISDSMGIVRTIMLQNLQIQIGAGQKEWLRCEGFKFKMKLHV